MTLDRGVMDTVQVSARIVQPIPGHIHQILQLHRQTANAMLGISVQMGMGVHAFCAQLANIKLRYQKKEVRNATLVLTIVVHTAFRRGLHRKIASASADTQAAGRQGS